MHHYFRAHDILLIEKIYQQKKKQFNKLKLNVNQDFIVSLLLDTV